MSQGPIRAPVTKTPITEGGRAPITGQDIPDARLAAMIDKIKRELPGITDEEARKLAMQRLRNAANAPGPADNLAQATQRIVPAPSATPAKHGGTAKKEKKPPMRKPVRALFGGRASGGLTGGDSLSATPPSAGTGTYRQLPYTPPKTQQASGETVSAAEMAERRRRSRPGMASGPAGEQRSQRFGPNSTASSRLTQKSGGQEDFFAMLAQRLGIPYQGSGSSTRTPGTRTPSWTTGFLRGR